jgi:multiple antibiotic resistance protein
LQYSEVLIILLITAFATKAGAYFMAHSGHLSPADRRTIAIQSVSIQAVVLSIFVAFGPIILHFFHVSISALEIAGGLILLLFAINLVLGEDHSADDSAPKAGIGMAAYPLAVPLLASPQAIVAVTIFSTTGGPGGRGMLWAALATVIAANLAAMLAIATFAGGKKDDAHPGLSLAPILLRVVALLLAALAVEIMALGLRGYGILPPMPGVAH